MMGEFFANRKGIKDFRKKLRNNATSAEAALWNLLKNKKLNGLKFRRQHSLGNYIVDFYCSSIKLIIELDGNPHGSYSQIEKDKTRDEFLINMGYKILRFENRFVFQDPDFVLEEILKTLTTNGQ
jgi:very-short-patch-repair endonuclease